MMSLMNETNTTLIVDSLYFPRPIQFGILLFLVIISIPCSVYLLYHLLSDHTLYMALPNHSIILLLISNAIQTITDVPLFLIYYYKGVMLPQGVPFCVLHDFLDYDLFTTTFFLLIWLSIERHIFIFQTRLYNTRVKRLILHYIPLGFCCIYPLIYYIIFMLFYPCKNYYQAAAPNCVSPCYLMVSNFMALYEEIVHGIAPMFVILLVNSALIIRVLQQKRRFRRQPVWARHFPMMIQLVGVCVLFFTANSGYFIIQLGQLLLNDISFGSVAGAWLYPMSLVMPPLMPFVCLNSLPDLKQKLKQLIPRRNRTAVVPLRMT